MINLVLYGGDKMSFWRKKKSLQSKKKLTRVKAKLFSNNKQGYNIQYIRMNGQQHIVAKQVIKTQIISRQNVNSLDPT